MEFSVMLPPRELVPYLCMIGVTGGAVWTLICVATAEPERPWRWGDPPRGRGPTEVDLLIHIIGLWLSAIAGFAAATL